MQSFLVHVCFHKDKETLKNFMKIIDHHSFGKGCQKIFNEIFFHCSNPLKKELPFKVNDPAVRSICQKVQATQRKLHKDLQTADTEVSKDIISLAFYQEKLVCEGSPKVFPLSFHEVYFILKQNIMV